MKLLENYLQDKCNNCQICCRFPEKYSPLIPYFLDKEIKDEGLFPCIGTFYGCRIDVVKHNNNYSCPYFNHNENNCNVYSSRPLDCRLYPFMITYDEYYEKVILVLDENCPYAEEIKKFQKEAVEFIDGIELGLQNIGFINDYQENTVLLCELPKLTAIFANEKGVIRKIPKEGKSIRQYLWRDIVNTAYLDNEDKDYVYLREDILKQSGDKYKDKRNLCNYFEKNYEYKIKKMVAADEEITECLFLYKKWAKSKIDKNKDPFFRQLIEDSFFFHRRALLDFNKLDLKGIGIYIKEKLAGYTFGVPICENTFCVLGEITDKEYKGINQFIFREICRIIPDEYEYINVMDDSDIEGLRKNKLSYRPVRNK